LRVSVEVRRIWKHLLVGGVGRRDPRRHLCLDFIEANRLMGTGIGYTDVHVLASARLSEGARLWTDDTRLAAAARRLFVSWDPRTV
jgi:hypothetical protein